jgi:cupin fold WbuC family metalloprotein
MIKIYSNVVKGLLLHQVCRFEEIQEERTNLCSDSSFIQCAALNMNKGKTFKPHRHITKNRNEIYTPQESWIILKGIAKVFLYDTDDSLLATYILKRGDSSFTFYGGHTYEIMENNTIVMEYKTGPYEGQSNDKIFI